MKVLVARWLGLGASVLAWVQCGGGDDERACTDIIQEAEGAIDGSLQHADPSEAVCSLRRPS